MDVVEPSTRPLSGTLLMKSPFPGMDPYLERTGATSTRPS